MSVSHLGEYMDYLFFAALNKCGNVDDANDLTQETLLSFVAFTAKGGTVENIKAWLTAVMNRKYYDMLRRKYKQPAVSVNEISEPYTDGDISDDIVIAEEAESIRREVAYLTKLYRDVVTMYYMQSKSVDEIAEKLCIPSGTVKYRLSKGREKIRKGIDGMEKYSDLSYQPQGLSITHSGNWGMNNEPRSLVNGDLLVQNILIAAYSEPLTEDEIAKTIGVPTAYIEEKVNMLVKNELMNRIGNRVYTDFVIYKPDERFKYIEAQEKLVTENFDTFWSPIQTALEKIRQTGAYKNLTDRQQNKFELYLTMKYLDYAVFNTGQKIFGEQILPIRPNGGRWIAFGYIKNDNINMADIQKYSYNGERHWYFKEYLNTKSICMHVYGTPLDYYPENIDHKYNMNEGDLTKLIYIMNENINPSEAGYNLAFLENIPYYVERGVFIKENGVLKSDIPVVPQIEYKDIETIIIDIIKEAAESLYEIMAEYLKDKAVVIPKHITSVPGHKKYMNAMAAIHMATVYKAKEKGLILSDADYPCPAMMVAVDK